MPELHEANQWQTMFTPEALKAYGALDRSTIHPGHACVHHSEAQMQCVEDELASPVSWHFETRFVGNMGSFPQAEIVKDGRVEGDTIETERAGRVSVQQVNGLVTSNWSLMEALQRLDGSEVLDFTLLDELDKIKPGQSVRCSGKMDMPFGDALVEVYAYRHVGQGFLPWFYYVDLNGRLLLAINGLRAYILDPNAEAEHEQVMSRFAQRS
ncbi:MAG: hypothetical protein QGG64_06525 [Candidatus Latescibacteria bacterium]|jgi:hypothetical protein|nr:hypothetical protein [Candidatus Latescibacterota bacterium]